MTLSTDPGVNTRIAPPDAVSSCTVKFMAQVGGLMGGLAPMGGLGLTPSSGFCRTYCTADWRADSAA